MSNQQRPGTLTAAEVLQVRDHSRLSRRVQKDRVILFFGRDDFSDNTKYAYLRALDGAGDARVLWCTMHPELAGKLADAGLPVLDMTADVQVTIDTLLHAAVAVFSVNPAQSLADSDVLISLLDGAVKVQLWHGISVKHLLLRLARHLSILDPTLRRPWETAARADYVLSTADMFDDFWHGVFGAPHLIRAGQPRNEVIVREATPRELIGTTAENFVAPAAQRQRPAVLVAPTWQREADKPMLMDGSFMRECVQLAKEEDVDVFFKLHPAFPSQPAQVSGRFHFVPRGLDIYPHLKNFDALVTDYSSIMFDYLLADKPVLRVDIGPGAHQTFEPDFSLVPDISFAAIYQRDSFRDVLISELSTDTRRAERLLMRDLIYPTDPLQATDRIVDVVAELASRRSAPAYDVV